MSRSLRFNLDAVPEEPQDCGLQRSRTVPSVSTAASSGDDSGSDYEDKPLKRSIQRSKTAPGLEVANLGRQLPADLVVRNTFLEFEEARLDFRQMRQTRSAPCTPQKPPLQMLPVEEEDTIDSTTVCNELVAASHGEQLHSGPAVLELANMLFQSTLRPPEKPIVPHLGTAAVPTVGSIDHHAGQCRPCAFVWKVPGCGNGVDCKYCHLCDPGEKKKRQKEKKLQLRADKERESGQRIDKSHSARLK